MVNALQHVGIGVTDIDRSYDFYRKRLNFKVKLSDLEDELEELVPMIGRKPRMRILNAFNGYGGASLELFQHIDTPPRAKSTPPSWGDRGFLELGIEVKGLERICGDLRKAGIDLLTGVEHIRVGTGATWRYVYLKDPDGLPIQLLEKDRDASSGKAPGLFCGIVHVGIGVSDLEGSLSFYRDVLGFDRELYHGVDVESGLDMVMPSPGGLETIILGRSSGSTARLASFTGGMVKLIHCKDHAGVRVFEGRRFGDLGLVEIGLDVDDVTTALAGTVREGAEEVIPPTDFDWGFGPCGTLAYLRDPEGNVVEFVSLKRVFKLPPGALNWLVIKPGRLLARLHVL